MEQEQITISKEEYNELLEKAKRLKDLESSDEESEAERHVKASLEDLRYGRIKRVA